MPRQRRSIFLIDADPAALVLGQRLFERLELPPPSSSTIPAWA